MKKIILLILWATSLHVLRAQIVINPQLPAGGLTIKSQLWNLAVVNTANGSIQAQVELSMTDLSNNQQVMTATTRVIDLPKGLKQLRATEAAPVLYNVTGGGYNIDGSPEGFLPVGNFQLCYTVIRVDLETSERVAEACETVVIEPLSPPQLISPADSEAVDLTRPLFSWLPPAPIQLFGNLTYEFRLAEVQNLQTGATAIQENMPLHVQGNLSVNSLQYPPSLPELDTGRLYAWQITAKSGLSEVARSEVWTFRINKRIEGITKGENGFFSRLNRENDAGYTVCYGMLRFAYMNETNDKEVPFSIRDIGEASRQSIALDSTSIGLKFGQHLGQLDLRNNHLQDKHIYLLELVNSRKEHWYLKFQYRKTN